MVSAARRAIERLYKGVCTIKRMHGETDPITRITKHSEVIVIENQPCRLSYKTPSSANQTDGAATVNQTIKLFMAPEIDVKPGSKIIVTQNGRTEEYSRSGNPSIYTNHQEIPLDLYKVNA